jgi:histidine triad (HIT) family protein
VLGGQVAAAVAWLAQESATAAPEILPAPALPAGTPRLHGRTACGSLPPAMSEKTIFQRIADHEIPADIVHEDDHCVCFRDLHPQAPIHLLLVPKPLVARITTADETDRELLGNLLLAARTVAEKLGIAETGFRVIINNGRDAGEEIPHLHLHILAGRRFGWPPG